jgi:L-serine dehydratase
MTKERLTGRMIRTSVFELFKIGPGPSSSHTIGPMRAGRDFLDRIRALPLDDLSGARSIEVRLFGSLSATGKGHGTDRAVLAGILGRTPEECPPDFLDGLLGDAAHVYESDVNGRRIPITADSIIFDSVTHDFPFNNTLIIRVMGDRGPLFEKEYYSVGGGFIQWKGWVEPARGTPLYPYTTMAEVKAHMARERVGLAELIMVNERRITGAGEEEINTGLDRIIDAMEKAVRRGIETEGCLPGPLGLHRKAPHLYRRAVELPVNLDKFLLLLAAYAFAGAEENGAGHPVVTAPTGGSAGVLPALLYGMKKHYHMPREVLRGSLLAASVVGFLAKQNASISGAEGGCQAEIGVASAMGAAMVAHARGCTIDVIEHSAETALEHHLGMTCDPIGGYVQVPCIERNAMGAVKAYTSQLIANTEVPEWHLVDLDRCISAMAETGRDMCGKYKETSEGGLAVCMVNC